jgi:acyl carrier protein
MNMDAQRAQRSGAALSKRAPDEPAIERWLVARLAALLGQPEGDVDITAPFSYYSLDSVAAVGLSGELEDWLGIELPVTLIWDYPSIESLSRHLAGRGEA